jgi:hypothetical protein
MLKGLAGKVGVEIDLARSRRRHTRSLARRPG